MASIIKVARSALYTEIGRFEEDDYLTGLLCCDGPNKEWLILDQAVGMSEGEIKSRLDEAMKRDSFEYWLGDELLFIVQIAEPEQVAS